MVEICRRCAVLALMVIVVVGGLGGGPAARAEDEGGAGEDIKAGSFNILTYRDKNNVSPTSWHEPDNRSKMIPEIIRDNDWDVVGLQEVGTAFARDDGSMTPSQIEDLRDSANLSAYDFAATDREGCNFSLWDAKPKNWTQPIAYRRDKFEPVAQGCFVMSETPDDFSASSFGWPRNVASWLRLRSRATGEELYMFNAHVAANIGPMGGGGKKVSQKRYRNHQVDQARALLSQIRSINTERLPMILTGDFNSTLETTPVSAAKTVVDSGMFVDAYSSAETVLADGGTWNGLVEGDKHDKIDHIFVGDEIAPTVSSYAVVPTMRKDADGTLHFASDHNAVSAQVILRWPQPSAPDPQGADQGPAVVVPSGAAGGYAHGWLGAISLIGALAVVAQVLFVKKSVGKGRHQR